MRFFIFPYQFYLKNTNFLSPRHITYGDVGDLLSEMKGSKFESVRDTAKTVLSHIKDSLPKNCSLKDKDDFNLLRKMERVSLMKRKIDFDSAAIFTEVIYSNPGRPRKRIHENDDDPLLVQIRTLIERHADTSGKKKKDVLDLVVKHCKTEWMDEKGKIRLPDI